MEERLLDDCVCPIGPLTPQDGRKTRESRPFRRALVAACRKDHLVLICRAQCRLVFEVRLFGRFLLGKAYGIPTNPTELVSYQVE